MLHPKQIVARNTRASEILHGVAAGGGKSHLERAAAIEWRVASQNPTGCRRSSSTPDLCRCSGKRAEKAGLEGFALDQPNLPIERPTDAGFGLGGDDARSHLQGAWLPPIAAVSVNRRLKDNDGYLK